MNRHLILSTLLLVGLGLAALHPVATAAPIVFDRVAIAGSPMQLPRGWARQQDEYSLILTESPDSPRSAVLALFAIAAQPGTAVAPATLAEAILGGLELASRGISETRIEERAHGAALYRLHRLQQEGDTGYLASFTWTDSASGALIHLFFSAPEVRFVELGGPVLPLVVFGGMDSGAIEAVKRDAAAAAPPHQEASCGAGTSLEVCLAERWFGKGGTYAAPSASSLVDRTAAACRQRTAAARNQAELAAAQAECDRSYANASRILAMSHQTSMKILHSIGGGWCYRGESGCY
jgi:hypothetical protein